MVSQTQAWEAIDPALESVKQLSIQATTIRVRVMAAFCNEQDWSNNRPTNALPSRSVGVDESSSGPLRFESGFGSSVSPCRGEAISTRGYDVLYHFLSWTFNQLITRPADRKYWTRSLYTQLGTFVGEATGAAWMHSRTISSEEGTRGGLWMWSLD